MRRHHFLAITLALALLAACSGGSKIPRPTGVSPSPSESASPVPSATPTPTPLPVDVSKLRIAVRSVATGLTAPLFLTHAGGTAVYIVEQAGVIKKLEPSGRAAPYLDIRGRVGTGGERGLLGLAFHPAFATNGRLFVNYTNRSGDTRVSEFRGTAARADPATERVMLRIDQPFPNHNGGMLAFGPDGFLYVATGDGGSGGDPRNYGQRTDTLLGKLLRIDVDGTAPYRSPPGNPFLGRAGADEIWAYGLRNPWRFSFDRGTGDLWVADVGQGAFEEVNMRPAPLRGGDNYGWRVMEGRSCFNASTCRRSGFVLPVTQYGRKQGDCSVTGGYVYRGAAHPSLRGAYLYGDYCSGLIRAVSAEDARDGDARSAIVARTGRPLASFGEDASGEVYVVFLDGGVGRIAPA